MLPLLLNLIQPNMLYGEIILQLNLITIKEGMEIYVPDSDRILNIHWKKLLYSLPPNPEEPPEEEPTYEEPPIVQVPSEIVEDSRKYPQSHDFYTG